LGEGGIECKGGRKGDMYNYEDTTDNGLCESTKSVARVRLIYCWPTYHRTGAFRGYQKPGRQSVTASNGSLQSRATKVQLDVLHP